MKLLRFLRWPAGLAALGLSYAAFELPGLLIALFVGGVVVTAARRKKSPIACIEVDGFRVDLAAMTMKKRKEEYAIRRTQDGRWEARPVSVESIGVVVDKRMKLSEEQHAESLERSKALLDELSGDGRDAQIPSAKLAQAIRTLPPGSRGRKVLGDVLANYVKTNMGPETAEESKKGEDEIETLQAMQDWGKDNGGFGPMPVFEAPIETAYQRYIRQG